MIIMVWLAVGGLSGWAVSVMMCTDTQQRLALNVAVGVVGGFLGGWLLSDLFSSSTAYEGRFSLAGVVVSLMGAVVLVGLARLVSRA